MVKERDELQNIVNKKIKKTGALKKEAELFEELRKFSPEEETAETPDIISFTPDNVRNIKTEYLPVRLAAASEALSETGRIKSDFYYHHLKNIALKISIKNLNQVYATVIAESDMDLNDAIIYCNEIDKYFIEGNANEFFIGSYDNFDLKKFSFDLLAPVNKITVFKTGDSYGHSVEKPEILINDIKIHNSGIKLRISTGKDIRVIIIKTGSYKDFIQLKDGIINIPEVLMNERTELLFY